MSRLIDEKKLREDIDNIVIKEMKAHLGEDECGDTLLSVTTKIIKCIEQQPTAYDVDKVIKELESLVEDREEDIINDEYTYGECSAYESAIRVVKRGGLDETKIL